MARTKQTTRRASAACKAARAAEAEQKAAGAEATAVADEATAAAVQASADEGKPEVRATAAVGSSDDRAEGKTTEGETEEARAAAVGSSDDRAEGASSGGDEGRTEDSPPPPPPSQGDAQPRKTLPSGCACGNGSNSGSTCANCDGALCETCLTDKVRSWRCGNQASEDYDCIDPGKVYCTACREVLAAEHSGRCSERNCGEQRFVDVCTSCFDGPDFGPFASACEHPNCEEEWCSKCAPEDGPCFEDCLVCGIAVCPDCVAWEECTDELEREYGYDDDSKWEWNGFQASDRYRGLVVVCGHGDCTERFFKGEDGEGSGELDMLKDLGCQLMKDLTAKGWLGKGEAGAAGTPATPGTNEAGVGGEETEEEEEEEAAEHAAPPPPPPPLEPMSGDDCVGAAAGGGTGGADSETEEIGATAVVGADMAEGKTTESETEEVGAAAAMDSIPRKALPVLKEFRVSVLGDNGTGRESWDDAVDAADTTQTQYDGDLFGGDSDSEEDESEGAEGRA